MSLPVKLSTTGALGWTGSEFGVKVDGATIGVNGSNQLEALGGGGGAPTDAEYVVAASHTGLSAERVLTAGTGFAIDNTVSGQSIVKLASGYGLLSGLTNNQVAVASGASSLDSSSSLTFDGTNLYSGTRVQIANAGTGAPLVVGNQSSANSAPFSGSAAHLVGADSADAVVCLDAIGPSTEPLFLGRGARGTLASKTQASNGHVLVRLGGTGYTSSSAYSTAVRGSVDIRSTESWTSTAQGTAISLKVTNKGTTTVTTPVDVLPYAVNITPAARKSTDGASAPLFLVTGNSDTALAASTNTPDVHWNLGRTVQFATGAKTQQDAKRTTLPTYSAVGATTITDAFTDYVTGAPAAGTNATLTRTWARGCADNEWVGGKVRIGDGSAIGAPGFSLDVQGTIGATGLITSSVAAGSPVMKFNATSDTPATTWTAGVPSNNPAGFLEVDVGGAARYIPFWT